MKIELHPRISFTTEHAASSYGIPVLAVDGEAFGSGDECTNAVRAALDNPADELNWLLEMYSGKQLVLDLCKQAGPDAIKAWHEWAK